MFFWVAFIGCFAQRRPRVNNYKSFTDEKEAWRVYALVDVDIIRLQKKLNVVSLHLEAKGDMTFHVFGCCQHDRRYCSNCRNDVN
jgi:hypothetical protein